MPLPEAPLLSVFPLFRRGSSFTHLGCGFFVGADGVFLTARHVLPDQPLELGESLVAVLPRHDVPQVAAVDPTTLRTSPRFDIAAGRIETSFPFAPLEIATAYPPNNIDLLCVEFSRTQRVVHADQRDEMTIHPAHQRGHMVSHYLSDRVGGGQSWVIELSFPALRGASGSAVVHGQTGQVVGMLVANVGHHLLPAQLERVEGPHGEVEEVRYYLPYGLALSWQHLREFLGI